MNKGALALVVDYGSDSTSDDEIPGARVSTKRCHKDSDEETPKRRYCRKLRLLMQGHR